MMALTLEAREDLTARPVATVRPRDLVDQAENPERQRPGLRPGSGDVGEVPKPPIADFLSVYPKQATRKSYGAAVLLFLDSQYGRHRAGKAVTPEEREVYERLAGDYLARATDHVGDIIRFIAAQGDEAPPKSVAVRVAGVIQFLIHHDLDLSARDRRRIRQKMPRGGAVSKRGDLNHEEIRQILKHCDEHGRALFLLLASSGMRIGEALVLRFRDVDLEAVPATIEIRAGTTKARQTRTAFMSSEAVDEMRSWLKVRDKYLAETVERSGHGCVGKKEATSDRLFPFSDKTAESHWRTALGQAGLLEIDERTGRATRTPHGLRAFFKSNLMLSCPEPVVDEIIGHEGYLSSSYRRYSPQQLAECYAAAEHHVIIQIPKEYTELKSKVADRLQAHSELLEDLSVEKRDLRARVAALEAENATIIEAAQVLKEIAVHPVVMVGIRQMARSTEIRAAHEVGGSEAHLAESIGIAPATLRIPRCLVEVIDLAPGVLREYEAAGVVKIVEDEPPRPMVRL